MMALAWHAMTMNPILQSSSRSIMKFCEQHGEWGHDTHRLQHGRIEVAVTVVAAEDEPDCHHVDEDRCGKADGTDQPQRRAIFEFVDRHEVRHEIGRRKADPDKRRPFHGGDGPWSALPVAGMHEQGGEGDGRGPKGDGDGASDGLNEIEKISRVGRASGLRRCFSSDGARTVALGAFCAWRCSASFVRKSAGWAIVARIGR